MENSDCNNALLRIFPKISLKKMESIVNDTEFLTDLQKQFYNTMLVERYNRILKPAYQKLNAAKNC